MNSTSNKPKINETLPIAFSGLLNKLGISTSPDKLTKFFLSHTDSPVIWQLIPDYDKRLALDEEGYLGTWPSTNDAVVKFQYQPHDQPYIEINGEQHANIVDVFCQVADYQEHLIVDTDGQVKSPSIYGVPVSWGRYSVVNPEPETVKPGTIKKRILGRITGRHSYILGEGETVWDVAAKFDIPSDQLIEHNNLKDPANLPAGYQLHLPYAINKSKPKDVQPVRYMLLDKPKWMHVTKKGGTKKYSFGSVSEMKDLKPTGPTVPENGDVEIYAVAHLLINDKTVEFYMDKLSIGNYAETGLPAYTIGFNEADLADGKAELPKVTVPGDKRTIVYKVKAVNQNLERHSPGFASLPTTKIDMRNPDPDPMSPANQWHQTYKSFPDGPKKYIVGKSMWVQDMMGKRPDKMVSAGSEVSIAGTFEKDGQRYARPVQAAMNFNWFGIPVETLTTEHELYHAKVDLPTRASMNSHLSLEERGVVALSKTLANYSRLKTFLGSKNKKVVKE